MIGQRHPGPWPRVSEVHRRHRGLWEDRRGVASSETRKRAFHIMEIRPASWDTEAQSKSECRKCINLGSVLYRAKLVKDVEAKRKRRDKSEGQHQPGLTSRVGLAPHQLNGSTLFDTIGMTTLRREWIKKILGWKNVNKFIFSLWTKL